MVAAAAHMVVLYNLNFDLMSRINSLLFWNDVIYSSGKQHLGQWKPLILPKIFALIQGTVLESAHPEDSKTVPGSYIWPRFAWVN